MRTSTGKKERDDTMIPRTPRGFRDVLPTEAAWRLSIKEALNDRFKLWGYLPVETPTLELLDVLEMGGKLTDTPFRFFDSDQQQLVLRPDVTLPVARMAALRMAGSEEPLRLCYAHQVFVENDSTYGQDRQVTQAGVECIGPQGAVADAELLCLLFEALAATGLSDFTVAIGAVGVLNALVEGASADAGWKREVLAAFHASDLVSLGRLAADGRAKPIYARAISKLARIRGGREAFQQCRELVAPLGCEDGLSVLERSYDLVTENVSCGKLLVDFSIISSLDYYSGMVFKAYVPQVAKAVASGGRYDHTLAKFGADRPAAGFAISLEPLMQGLEEQGVNPPQVGPDRVVEGQDAQAMFAEARELRARGVRVVLGGERA